MTIIITQPVPPKGHRWRFSKKENHIVSEVVLERLVFKGFFIKRPTWEYVESAYIHKDNIQNPEFHEEAARQILGRIQKAGITIEYTWPGKGKFEEAYDKY